MSTLFHEAVNPFSLFERLTAGTSGAEAGAVTVTSHVAVLPLTVVAVIVAVPGAIAVTVPSETVAALVLLLVHVTVLSDASEGKTVAVRVSIFPGSRVRVVLLRVTEDGSSFMHNRQPKNRPVRKL